MQRTGFAFAVALGIHALVAIVVLSVEARSYVVGESRVEIEISPAAPPTPPEPSQAPPTPPPSSPVRTRLAAKVADRHLSAREPQVSARPSPDTAARLDDGKSPSESASDVRPVFGVTMSSILSGEAAMELPASNTTSMNPGANSTTNSFTPATPGGPGRGNNGIGSGPAVYVAAGPQLLHEVDSENTYPAQAKALGIEGTVEAILDIDDRGSVLSVKITKRAGHGFDEAASAALKQFRFTPAVASNGRLVASRLGWKYTFVVKD